MKSSTRSLPSSPPRHGTSETGMAPLYNMRITLDQDLASWVTVESRRMGLSPSTFISTLLEWARSEQIVEDDVVGVFHPAAASRQELVQT